MPAYVKGAWKNFLTLLNARMEKMNCAYSCGDKAMLADIYMYARLEGGTMHCNSPHRALFLEEIACFPKIQCWWDNMEACTKSYRESRCEPLKSSKF